MLLTNLRPSVPNPALPLEVYNKRSTSHNKQTQLFNLGPGQAARVMAHLPLLFPLCSVVSHVVVLPVRNPRELHSPLAFRFETMATCALLLPFHIFLLIRTFGTNTKSFDCGYKERPGEQNVPKGAVCVVRTQQSSKLLTLPDYFQLLRSPSSP